MVVLALVLVLVQVLVVVLVLALVLVLELVCWYTGSGTCLRRLQRPAALQRAKAAAARQTGLAELQQPLAAPKGDDSPSPEVEIQGGGLGDIESS